MLKLITDKHEASRGLSATAELLVNYPERSLTQISSSRHYLTLNVSETVRDTDYTQAVLKDVISNDLE